ncbi:MAG: hypothetical protein ISS70_13460 [Phycisphaerae bacterium]|nr:hypothetical protein [Phycisphaerae bacterium]
MKRTAAALMALVGILFAGLYYMGKRQQELSVKNLSTLVRQAVAQGRILFKLTTPEEFKEIVGQPTKEWTDDSGKSLRMEYPGVQVDFGGLRLNRQTDDRQSSIQFL